MRKQVFYPVMVVAVLLSGAVYAVDESLIEKANKPAPKIKKAKPKIEKKRHTSKKARAEIRKLDSDMVSITGGCFQMGSPESEKDRLSDERQHEVCVKDFQIGKYEVTQAQWQAVMGNNPSNFKGENLPVETVSWNDVQTFLEKLNAQTGKNYRLPTEAEWEYAARAGTTTAYYWGNEIDCSKANYGDACNIKKTTTSVGSYSANPWGLYDMAANVWEWTCSAYIENYDGSENKCSGDAQARRVVRGGSWGGFPQILRSAIRFRYYSIGARDDRGFRVARAL